MMTQETTVNSNGQTVYKSRWGYHPCDYETFLKLKELNKLFEKSKQDACIAHSKTRTFDQGTQAKLISD